MKLLFDFWKDTLIIKKLKKKTVSTCIYGKSDPHNTFEFLMKSINLYHMVETWLRKNTDIF